MNKHQHPLHAEAVAAGFEPRPDLAQRMENAFADLHLRDQFLFGTLDLEQTSQLLVNAVASLSPAPAVRLRCALAAALYFSGEERLALVQLGQDGVLEEPLAQLVLEMSYQRMSGPTASLCIGGAFREHLDAQDVSR